MLSALVLCNDVIAERTRQNIDFCMFFSNLRMVSGALTNETKSVRYKYWGFVISRFIPTHFIIPRAKKIIRYYTKDSALWRSLYRGSFVGIKLFLPGAVTIGKFCFVSFPAFRKKTREPSDSCSQFETF